MNYRGARKSKVMDVVEGYDLYADYYDKDWDYLSSFERDTLMRMLGDLSGKNVLDLGCGTGRLIRDLKNLGGFVTGVDVSEKMLEAARDKFHDVKFVLGDAEKLPFKDSEFDLVVAAFLVVHLKNLDEAFEEIYRVLKDGGICILTNINQRKAPKLLAGKRKIVIKSYYHRPAAVREALLSSFFKIEKEEFVKEGKIWINQVIRAVKF